MLSFAQRNALKHIVCIAFGYGFKEGDFETLDKAMDHMTFAHYQSLRELSMLNRGVFRDKINELVTLI